jgi:hypothetical protein
MENERRNDDDARREYEAPELTVLASVRDATLAINEGTLADGVNFSNDFNP